LLKVVGKSLEATIHTHLPYNLLIIFYSGKIRKCITLAAILGITPKPHSGMLPNAFILLADVIFTYFIISLKSGAVLGFWGQI
jgi:hypothetical protein